MKKQKVYYIMISEFFPSYHLKAGQPTNFEEKIRSEEKKHTIRQNYEFWKKREPVINSGEGILSIRKWADKPYHSKHIELFQVQVVNVQKIHREAEKIAWCVDDDQNKLIRTEELAKNDGLEPYDFYDWFKSCPDNLGCIISFGHFKY